MPRKVFVAGEILTASDVNTNLMDQAVMVFDDASARTTAIPTPVEGMVTYLSDVNQVQAFTGSAFTPVGGILQVVQTVKSDRFTTSSSTYTAVTGFTASITPSSTSSKILVVADIVISNGNTSGLSHTVHVRLTGGGAGDYIGSASGSRERSAFSLRAIDGDRARFFQFARTLTFLDSPNTTGSVTYGLDMRMAVGGVGTFNGPGDNFDDEITGLVPSSLTLIEVAG